jgi:hypothetical protein
MVPNRTRGSDQESRDNQQWSLDLEVSTEDEPSIHQIVLDPQNSLQDPSVTTPPLPIEISANTSARCHTLPAILQPDSPQEGLASAPQTLSSGPRLGLVPEVFQETILDWPARTPSVDPPGFPLPPPPLLLERAHYRCTRCENIVKVQRELAQRRKELLTARTHVQSEQASLARLREFEFKAREILSRP